jgi:hypothetical protein
MYLTRNQACVYSAPGVRIPPSPPVIVLNQILILNFCFCTCEAHTEMWAFLCLAGVDVAAGVQSRDERLIEAAAAEVEAAQIAVDGEAGDLHLIGQCTDLPFGGFGLQQLRWNKISVVEDTRTRCSTELIERRRQRRHQLPHHVLPGIGQVHYPAVRVRHHLPGRLALRLQPIVEHLQQRSMPGSVPPTVIHADRNSTRMRAVASDICTTKTPHQPVLGIVDQCKRCRHNDQTQYCGGDQATDHCDCHRRAKA